MIPDPNRLLDSIRELVNAAEEDEKISGEEFSQLVEWVAMLDEWLSKGGALPAPWSPLKPDKT